MNKLFIAAALAATLGLPSIATAETASTGSTIVCRPAASGETANATIQNGPFVCHAFNMEKVRSAMASVMSSLTPEQKAKMDFAMQVLRDELQLQPQYPGFNGNPNN